MTKTTYPIAHIIGLFTGKTATPWAGKPPSAIGKTLQNKPLGVLEQGLEGDEQADPEAHGGPDQAIHHYPSDHMPFWQSIFPAQEQTFQPGCFGENLATLGVDEHSLCIGDTLSLGTAIVQVSQGRRPCWKLDAHIGRSDVAHHFLRTVRTGWYYRVIQPGTVEAGEDMHVLGRACPDWPIAKVTQARFDPKLDRDIAVQLAELAPLSTLWRSHFAKMA